MITLHPINKTSIYSINISLLLRPPWMGQASSTGAGLPSRKIRSKHCYTNKNAFSMAKYIITTNEYHDFTLNLPDECLAFIFHFLGSADRKHCSLVCTRWLQIEGQSRHRLSLNAQSDLIYAIPSIFSRFDSVTKLALKCDRRSVSIGDEAFSLISQRCPNLTRMKLIACRELTDSGMYVFASNCKNLKKLSCGSCSFGAKGMNVLLNNCSNLEELSVKRLLGITDGVTSEPIGSGAVSSPLKMICLKDLYNGQCFGPLIIGSKNLRALKIYRCSGNWDKLLEVVTERVNSLVEIHLERVQVGDTGLAAISNCSRLEILHLVKTPECTNEGLKYVAENCKLLRKLHIDGWKTNRICDEGLNAVAKYCVNLQELVLIGVNPTRVSLEPLAMNCQNLERLALCGSETVGDAEISCIATKCVALKKLCIKSCPVSDHGMEALAAGCPNLVNVRVKKCRAVTSEGADWLRKSRGSLAVNLDTTGPVENQQQRASDSAQEVVGMENQIVAAQVEASSIASSSTGRPTSFKARLGFTVGRNLVACTLRRWSSFSGSSQTN